MAPSCCAARTRTSASSCARPAATATSSTSHTSSAGVSLADAVDRLRAAGSAPEEVEVPIRGGGLRVTDPDGNPIVLVERVLSSDRIPPVARYTDELPAFHPRRLQHFNYLTADVPRLADWYERALGMKISDWIGDGAVWMHADRDHHVVAFLDKGYPHIHHLAFELVDWGEMRVALDHLAQHRRPIAWGPGRHTMAQNLFAYCRMVEEEVFVELFCDMERLEPDHEPRYFEDDPHGSNAWGILRPAVVLPLRRGGHCGRGGAARSSARATGLRAPADGNTSRHVLRSRSNLWPAATPRACCAPASGRARCHIGRLCADSAAPAGGVDAARTHNVYIRRTGDGEGRQRSVPGGP